MSFSAAAFGAPRLFAANLRPEALEAFNRYVRATEARIDAELARPGAMLYLDGLPEPRRRETFDLLKRGETSIERLRTPGPSGDEPHAPGALIHHWIGTVFIPGATLQQTLDFVRDYDHHARYYQPEIVRSKLLGRSGNDFRIWYRFQERRIITITLDTEYEVHYTVIDRTHAYSRAYSTRVAEVQDAGRPQEREKSPEQGHGYLWRINSYWRFEERDGGVYAEWEWVALTRNIPLGLRWLLAPLARSIPKESLEFTLRSTRAGVLARR